MNKQYLMYALSQLMKKKEPEVAVYNGRDGKPLAQGDGCGNIKKVLPGRL